ncbi:NUDIX hydrolase [[Clostridium] polysaccharolyticum]|uniref:NUDIX domain-containing protein n=1 Tax=[Clostridium] polysaccharolyticum TaxID=29364 RepID=A0A1H9ZPI7_9FIRM|nr:NUDIX domain-containing protein [[Clostridium] polysaccharolyticum]SES83490.1 NUDIX domain-containing protein [[Clostridium] polysaccharolyticum]
MEYFELLNADGTKMGKVKERNLVHQDGDWHGGSHIWVVRKKDEPKEAESKYEVLLQKRKKDKDSFPGCYDVSCAGHMDKGETFLSTALRELLEELNLSVTQDQITFLFSQRVEGEYVFHGRPFVNREVNYVYLLNLEVALDNVKYQEEEIEELVWMDLDRLCFHIENRNPKFCIWQEEMKGLYDYLTKMDVKLE